MRNEFKENILTPTDQKILKIGWRQYNRKYTETTARKERSTGIPFGNSAAPQIKN